MFNAQDIMFDAKDPVDVIMMTDNTFEDAIKSYENSKAESVDEGGLLDPVEGEFDDPLLSGVVCYNEQVDDSVDVLDMEAQDILENMNDPEMFDDEDGELIDSMMGEE